MVPNPIHYLVFRGPQWKWGIMWLLCHPQKLLYLFFAPRIVKEVPIKYQLMSLIYMMLHWHTSHQNSNDIKYMTAYFDYSRTKIMQVFWLLHIHKKVSLISVYFVIWKSVFFLLNFFISYSIFIFRRISPSYWISWTSLLSTDWKRIFIIFFIVFG